MNRIVKEIETFFTAILLKNNGEIYQIESEIDNIFSQYSFFPEIEWHNHNCTPPNGYQVLNAWRHPNKESYGFLMNNPARQEASSNAQLLIFVKSDNDEINKIKSMIHKLKQKYFIEDSPLDERINRVHKLKVPAFLITILAVFTAIVNAFSIYLSKISAPAISNHILLALYALLVSIFHILAMVFIISFCLFFIVFMAKYGLLIIKKV